jgi:hypothetical protein
LLFFAGLLFLACAGAAAIKFAVHQGLLAPQWAEPVDQLWNVILALMPEEKTRVRLAWIAGVALSLLGAALSFVATWHFLEMNLPRRIEALKRYHLRDHLELRPRLIAVARPGLMFIPADIEASRVTLIRKWWSRWSLKEQARVLAATAHRLGDEASALESATRFAQAQQITALIIRGYQYAVDGDKQSAYDDFKHAASVRKDDILSRDIAADWARCMNDQAHELALLREIRADGVGPRSFIDKARSFRREAEVIARRNSNAARGEALNLLHEARGILEPNVADRDAKEELVRVLMLFCEIRCDKGTPGKLRTGNQPLARMNQYREEVDLHERPEEQCGEKYTSDRARRVTDRVARLEEEGLELDE